MKQEHIIDKLLRNETLTEEELTWWNDNKDSEIIKGEHEFLQELRAPLAIENKKILKNELKSFEKTTSNKTGIQQSKRGKIVRLKTWSAIAATLLVLITSVVVLRNQRNISPFDKYFEPYPSIVSPLLKGGQSASNQMDEIMQHYQNENYPLVSQMMDSSPISNDTLVFYHANALLHLNQIEKARNLFSDLQTSNNRFTKEAQWYEALSYLKLNQQEQAQNKLELITLDPQHPYQEEALGLLREIK